MKGYYVYFSTCLALMLVFNYLETKREDVLITGIIFISITFIMTTLLIKVLKKNKPSLTILMIVLAGMVILFIGDISTSMISNSLYGQ